MTIPTAPATYSQREMQRILNEIYGRLPAAPVTPPATDGAFWMFPGVPFRVEKPRLTDLRWNTDTALDLSTNLVNRTQIVVKASGFPAYGLFAANLHDALIDVGLVQGATGPNGQKCMRIGGERVVIRGKADNTKGGNDVLLFFANDGAVLDYDFKGGQIHLGVPVNNVSQYEADLRTMYLLNGKHAYGNQQQIPQCLTIGCRIKEAFIGSYQATGGTKFLGIEMPVGWKWNGEGKPCTSGPGADPLPIVHVGKFATWNGRKPTLADCRGLCETNPGCLMFES